MPTLPVGTGDRAAELYYELRDGGEASTSDRFAPCSARGEGFTAHRENVTNRLHVCRSEVERLEVLMIMGECWATADSTTVFRQLNNGGNSLVFAVYSHVTSQVLQPPWSAGSLSLMIF